LIDLNKQAVYIISDCDPRASDVLRLVKLVSEDGSLPGQQVPGEVVRRDAQTDEASVARLALSSKYRNAEMQIQRFVRLFN
jgi:hypothetical protein